MARTSKTDVATELAALESMDRPALQAQWRERFGTPPPKKSRRDFLKRAIAYRIQENAYGGLRPATKKRLRNIAAELRAGKTPKLKRRRGLAPGTRLVREWNGDTHVVDVTEDGYAFRGKRFDSLSAIAREITGAHWSGPRFFGLMDQKAKEAVEARS